MRKDHRPYYIKQAWLGMQKFYIRKFLEPQLDHLGKNAYIIKPWHVEIFGAPITIGDNITLFAASDKKTRLTVWSDKKDITGIKIGDHALISPGVRISAAKEILIGDNCMLASGVYITDSDWHGIYDRSMPPEKACPVKLEPNVWVGDSSIICKGVHIGENSIIGAGAVVSSDIPAFCIAAGNPAKIVKRLDPDRKIITRRDRFSDTDRITMLLDENERKFLSGNTLTGWFRYLFFPSKKD